MNNVSKSSYLLKNTLIFTIGNIGPRLISFFFIPLYTNILTTSQYGVVDLVAILCTVLAPVVTLNIAESVMRFGLDKDANKEKNTQCGTVVYLISIVWSLFLIPICQLVPMLSSYSLYIFFYIVSFAACQLYLCDLRGKELLFQYSIGNLLQTVLIAVFNILFLVTLQMEIKGYLLAYITSNCIVSIYAILIGKGYKSFKLYGVDKCLLKNMISYSIVLMPNTFMWWIMNSSDRVMISYMLGPTLNGIYAISYKIPTLMSILSNIFNQAWGYSAIRENGSKDEEVYNNTIFRMLTAFVIITALALIMIIKPFLKIYVSSSYYSAWKYTPFLIIGYVYLTLATFMATSYTVHKDSFGYLFSGMFGAIFNIVMNYCLIPIAMVYGAAFSTCISYILVFFFRLFHTRKYIRYDINNKEFIIGSLLLILSAILMFWNSKYAFIAEGGLLLIAICLFFKTWSPLFKRLFSINRK